MKEESKININILPRVCRTCGITFDGGPRAWYCPACRKERERKSNREFKQRKKSGNVVPLGSIIKCQMCGKDIIKNSGLQQYCELCAAKHLIAVDNEQSLKWKRENHEKIIESKRKCRKNRHANEKTIDTLMNGVAWDKGGHTFKAYVQVDGKQVIIIKSIMWQRAFSARIAADKIIAKRDISVDDVYKIRDDIKNGRIILQDYIKYTKGQMQIYDLWLTGKTQSEIAREIGASRQYVFNILNDIKEVNSKI